MRDILQDLKSKAKPKAARAENAPLGSGESLALVVEECTRLKNASGRIRQNQMVIRIPKRWPRHEKQRAVESLSKRLLKSHQQKRQLETVFPELSAESSTPRLTLSSVEALTNYVEALNQNTFQTPRLTRCRIGQAKYSRLAQVNLKTGVMTVSQYCLQNVPECALRYLICHELAHFFEPSHNKRFWRLVEEFVPDYKYQSRLMKAFHQRATEADSSVSREGHTEHSHKEPLELSGSAASAPILLNPHTKANGAIAACDVSSTPSPSTQPSLENRLEKLAQQLKLFFE